MNDKVYEGLSADQKGIVDTAAKEALSYGDELSAASEKALGDKLQQAGMQFTRPDVAPIFLQDNPDLLHLRLRGMNERASALDRVWTA